MRIDDQIVPVCRLQFLLGIDNSLAWRRAKAGVWGDLVKDHRGRNAVSLAAVEAIECRHFTPDQVAHALATPSTPRARKSMTCQPRDLDPGLGAALCSLRDQQWLCRLRLAGVDLSNVKQPSAFAPSLEGQEFFNRAQAKQLIRDALADRDSEWKDWLRDPVAKAQFPKGPKQ